MDSIATAFWKRPYHAITIDYGQKAARAEIQAAAQICNYLGMQHHLISVDCSSLGSGDMNNSAHLPIAPVTEWWPFRNQLLITLACMKGVTLGITQLIVGSVKKDSSHADGTKEFYQSISKLTEFQEGNISIQYPAIELNTTDLIRKSEIPLSLLLWAHSCHTSNEPCLYCNGCKKYLFTLQDLGID